MKIDKSFLMKYFNFSSPDSVIVVGVGGNEVERLEDKNK